MNNKGFTLVEVLVSFVCMAIGMAALWGLHLSSMKVDVKNRRQNHTVSLASQKLEELRAAAEINFSSLAIGPIPSDNITVDGRTYTVTGNINAPETWRRDITVTCMWNGITRDRDGNLIPDNDNTSLTTYIVDN
jgi:Tfp pilus assembly protein PilV